MDCIRLINPQAVTRVVVDVWSAWDAVRYAVRAPTLTVDGTLWGLITYLTTSYCPYLPHVTILYNN